MEKPHLLILSVSTHFALIALLFLLYFYVYAVSTVGHEKIHAQNCEVAGGNATIHYAFFELKNYGAVTYCTLPANITEIRRMTFEIADAENEAANYNITGPVMNTLFALAGLFIIRSGFLTSLRYVE